MLRLQIHGDDVPGRWSWRDSSWTSGTSWIAPLQFPILTRQAMNGRGETTMLVREDRPGGDVTEVRLRADRSIMFRAGTGGTAPLYLATDGIRLFGSWDPMDLAGFASLDAVTPAVVARLLTRQHRYSADTLFATITRLTAGATITWSRGALSVRYPAPHPHVARPRRLRAGADPVAHLGALLDRSIEQVCQEHSGTVGVELSGGLDSANVALTVVRHAPGPVRSGGLIVGGQIGRAQVERRRVLIERLGLLDVTVAAADHLPLDPDGPRRPERPHFPDGDVYQEAFDVLRTRLSTDGVRLVFTGFGGDEVMGLAPAERVSPIRAPRQPTWLDRRALAALAEVDEGCSPVTAVALPTLVVFAARHPAYLRAGLWPIAPFAAPELSRFGRSLPVEHRAGKELLRRRLSRIGLPSTVTHPVRPESFAATMRASLRRNAPALLTHMLDHSPLIAAGFVRRKAVATLHRHACEGRALSPLLYDMLALDIGLRSMTSTPTAGPALTRATDATATMRGSGACRRRCADPQQSPLSRTQAL